MTLYEIDARILELIDQETGELLDYDAFMSLQMEREAKIENMACWYKDLKAQAEAIKSEITSLTERKKAIERKSEHLKEYIGQALDGQKFSTARCEISFRQSTSLEVSDQDQLIEWAEANGHDDCVRYKPPEIDKKAVTDLLKSGINVPNAQLVQKLNVGVK